MVHGDQKIGAGRVGGESLESGMPTEKFSPPLTNYTRARESESVYSIVCTILSIWQVVVAHYVRLL